jgi:hypothetical protein
MSLWKIKKCHPIFTLLQCLFLGCQRTDSRDSKTHLFRQPCHPDTLHAWFHTPQGSTFFLLGGKSTYQSTSHWKKMWKKASQCRSSIETWVQLQIVSASSYHTKSKGIRSKKRTNPYACDTCVCNMTGMKGSLRGRSLGSENSPSLFFLKWKTDEQEWLVSIRVPWMDLPYRLGWAKPSWKGMFFACFVVARFLIDLIRLHLDHGNVLHPFPTLPF